MYVMQCEIHLCGGYHVEEPLGNECIILALYVQITLEEWELVIFCCEECTGRLTD